MRVWVFVVLPFLAVGAQADESLDYVTEHLFEASMNARDHSLPEIETDPASRAVRIKLGVARIDGGPMHPAPCNRQSRRASRRERTGP